MSGPPAYQCSLVSSVGLTADITTESQTCQHGMAQSTAFRSKNVSVLIFVISFTLNRFVMIRVDRNTSLRGRFSVHLLGGRILVNFLQNLNPNFTPKSKSKTETVSLASVTNMRYAFSVNVSSCFSVRISMSITTM